MKKLLLICSFFLCGVVAYANHITGGEMYYTLVSQAGNDFTYQITLKLYRDCNAPPGSAQLDPSVVISIFDNSNNANIKTQTVSQSQFITQNLSSPSKCIQSPPPVCYEVGFYTFTVTLPGIASGYTVTYQRCCRITGINNIVPNSNSFGATFTAIIPGTNSSANAPANNSAKFSGIDTVIVCANNSFCYNFGAFDADGDQLLYSFCNAYIGGSQGNSTPNPPSAPAYNSVPYQSPYNAFQPLGSGVTINSQTGLMCGIAPPPGIYVVTVCVQEIRNGVVIAIQRKDLQIKVGDCNVADADLKPEYISCDGFTYTFSNEAPPNVLINTYYWEISDGFTSTSPNPTHTFADTGVYTFKLVINRGQECSDSAISRIKVFPGFFPGFVNFGTCINKPIQFIDTTTTRYGVVDTWSWNFGDASSLADTSHIQNPTYTYSTAGTKPVTFIVTNSKGCIDTVQQDIQILTKPPLRITTRDTLICNGDSVQLHATGNGVFSWTPVTNTVNSNTPDPIVFPTTTTDYVVLLDDQGCLNRDTARVRVVNFVTLQAMPDTLICAGDTLQLRAVTDGLRFLWNNPATLNNPTLLMPLAKPVTVSTLYRITATIGRCKTTDDVLVTQIPYPTAVAGNDTSICFNTQAQLNGSIMGSSFTWSPVNTLSNANTLTPIATPKNTTAYVLSVYDVAGCPKPGRDTVIVKVNPEVVAFAGRDTSVVIGQPLQFNGSGGVSYLWSPPTGLSAVNIRNPKGFYDGSFDSIRYTLVVKDAIGCSDDATILVKVFKTDPYIFVPTGFTPNGDGRNDFVRPIAVGITRIDYFRVYNRWGQLVFETTINGKGWDGRIKGVEQGTATFVWLVKAEDYTGKSIFAKGNVTLIR